MYSIPNGSSDILHDIICITETWLNESYPDSLLTYGLPNRVFRHDRNTRNGGSTIFVNSCLSASRIMLPVDLADLEVVAAEVHTSSQRLIIYCIYNPSGQNLFSVKAIFDIVHYLGNKFCYICMLSNINVHLLEHCFTNNAHVPCLLLPLINALNAHSLDQIVTRTSRMQNYLDFIFCSNFLLHDNVHDKPHLGKSDLEC